MKNSNSFIRQLSPYLFWDIDRRSVDSQRHIRWLVERIISRGDLNDFLALLEFYPEEKIKNEVIKVRHWDKKTMAFLSHFFNIPLENFRCYEKKA